MGVRSVSLSLLALGFLGGSLATSGASLPLEPQSPSPPTLSRIAPTSGPVGTVLTLTGKGFAAQGNTATFGSGYIKNLESADGTALKFSVPDGLDLCPPDSLRPCPGAYPPVNPGDYVVAVITAGEKSSAITFTVTRP